MFDTLRNRPMKAAAVWGDPRPAQNNAQVSIVVSKEGGDMPDDITTDCDKYSLPPSVRRRRLGRGAADRQGDRHMRSRTCHRGAPSK
jgi:hypothetical protein